MAVSAGAIAIQSGYVLVAIALFALPIAITLFARSGPAWQSIGKGPFAMEQILPPPRLALQPPPSQVDPALLAAEARQMLEAKSYRQRRRGEAPIDVEGEMERVLDSASQIRLSLTEELRAEVRGLVVAGNERRLRRGEAPLDVEAETERQLSDCIGSD